MGPPTDFDKASRTIWIVVQEDRHIGVEVFPCSTLEKARDLAVRIANENATHPEDIEEEELSPRQRDNGTWMSIKYSIEEDFVTVFQRFMDEEER